MRVTRLLEGASSEIHASLNQEQFVSLVAKHKALLLQCDEGSDPLSADDFAQFMEGLQLQHYEYVGGAGERARTSSSCYFRGMISYLKQFWYSVSYRRRTHQIVAAPRRLLPVKANVEVYTANEAPPDQLIPFHHELAQVANPPQYIFFFCDLPSETGGETALIDSTLGVCAIFN